MGSFLLAVLIAVTIAFLTAPVEEYETLKALIWVARGTLIVSAGYYSWRAIAPIKIILQRARRPRAPEHTKPTALKQFFMGNGLPGYISAGSALTAVVLATFAYSSWKTQESAKRKANVAMEVLKHATAARRCIDLAMAPNMHTRTFDEKEVARIVRNGLRRMGECADALAIFGGDVFVVENALDQETFLAALRLHSYVTRKAGLFRELRELLEDLKEDEAHRERIVADINDCLDEIGVVIVSRENPDAPLRDHGYRNERRNPYPELYYRSKQVEMLLGAYIRFEDVTKVGMVRIPIEVVEDK